MTEIHLANLFARERPAEAARILEEFDTADIADVIDQMPGGASVAAMAHLNPDVAAQVIQHMEADAANQVVAAMDPVAAARFIGRLNTESADQLLAGQAAPHRRDLTGLLTHEQDTAGSLMDPHVSHFRVDETVSQAMEQIRRHPERHVTHL
ncbi:MAG: magnesium transporter, partial [Gemmatimonadetes bacterium]|nr:magnesium transporter [Gemmatimonadota bacterium]